MGTIFDQANVLLSHARFILVVLIVVFAMACRYVKMITK